ncbi:MAG: UMP kinase [Bacteroidales bacterium]|nr:UMP kinase [Bacteroidales bacterium]MDD3200684.1 UMP kinase [Bacteroidales bacterium]
MKYKRILLKLSGEAIGGADGVGLDEDVMKRYAFEIAQVVKKGVQVAIVIGGGNIFRGLAGTERGFDRVRGDQMGMLATVINSIGMSLSLRNEGVNAEVFTSTPMRPMAKYYMRDEVLDYMANGGVALIAGGTGNPFFTTDSASALRACELGADALLKGTKVDGVYNCDPKKHPDAVKYPALTFDKALDENLRVMDQTAFTLCKENNMPVIVFNAGNEGDLVRLIGGEQIGSIITN